MNLERTSRWETSVTCLLLLAATLGAYWPVFQCGFINFDDPDYVTQNMVVRRGLTLDGLVWAFSSGYAANWHPLTWLSHMLDCQLFGLNPVGHHGTNLLFHIANSMLLFLLLRRMTQALWDSAAVAALFALHPLHVESVAWIAERKDVLSTFLGLLSLWAYVRYAEKSVVSNQCSVTSSQASRAPATDHAPRTTDYGSLITEHRSLFYFLSLFFFACSLMSKPMLVTLPLILLVLDYWPLQRLSPSKVNSRLSTLFEKLPFFALSAISGIVTFLVQKHTGAITDSVIAPLCSRLGNAAVAYLRYLRKAAWPSDLAIAYPPVQWHYWQTIGAALVLLLVTCVILRARRAWLVTGWLWFLVTLAPVIGLVKIGSQSMADRYSYLPLVGPFVILVWGSGDLLRRLPTALRVGLLSLGLCVVIAFACMTSAQVRNWQSSYRLFAHALALNGDNAMAHLKLGEVFLEQQELAQAKAHFLAAFQLAPRMPGVYSHLGMVLMAQGQRAEAIGHWRTALQLQPGWLPLMNNLAWTLATCRDPACRNPAEAVRLAEQACAGDPRSLTFFDTLGAAYAAVGLFPEAATAAQRAISLAQTFGQTNVLPQFRARLELYRLKLTFWR